MVLKSHFILMCCVLSTLQRVWVNIQNIPEKCSMYLFKAAELSIFEMFSH